MNATKEKGRDSSAPTAAAIREIKVSRVEFKPPPKKRKNAGDDAEGWFKVEYSALISCQWNITTVRCPKQSAFASYWVQDAAAAWRFQSCGKKSARI